MVHMRRKTYCIQSDLHFVRSFICHATEAAAEGDLEKAVAILIYHSHMCVLRTIWNIALSTATPPPPPTPFSLGFHGDCVYTCIMQNINWQWHHLPFFCLPQCCRGESLKWTIHKYLFDTANSVLGRHEDVGAFCKTTTDYSLNVYYKYWCKLWWLWWW
jgi:hypothetical protein